MQKPKRVAIIGAGAAGLVAIKECLAQGLEPVCFEQNFGISFTCPGPESAVLKTSKEMMQFSDFPIPVEYPKFLSVKKCLEYLRLYAKEMGLRRYIKMGRKVQSIRQKEGCEQWEVIYKKLEKPARLGPVTPPLSRSESPSVSFDQSQEVETGKPPILASVALQDQELEERVSSIEIDRGVSIDYQPLSASSTSYELQFRQDRSSDEDLRKKSNSQDSPIPPPSKPKLRFKKDVFDYVMVCTGHRWKAKLPEFEGMDSFKGAMIHSQKYKVPYPYKDEKVLVVGVGNSGLDIATELCNHASKVYLSSRSGAWVAPNTTLFGMPTDHLSTRAVHSIPRVVLNYALESLVTLHHGDMKKYGLKPNHGFMEATPVVGSQVLNLIECGKIETKPNVVKINPNTVEFDDGSVEEVDAIIFATGFEIENPFLADPGIMGSPDEPNRVQLYKHVFSTTHSGICFIGMVKPNGSILPVNELQARWATQVFSGKQVLPTLKEMRDLTALDWQEHLKLYLPTDRMSIAVDQVVYMDFLANCIGVKPDLWKLWKTNWTLAMRVTFGPVASAQYRLGEWDGAEKAIEAACRDVDFKSLVDKQT